MNSLFFFDDWLLFAREGLDRKQGQPDRVKEIVLEHQADPDLKSIRNLGISYDEGRKRYVMDIDCYDRSDTRFFTRLETEDPYHWPAQRWSSGGGPLWSRADNAYLDQHRKPLDCFNTFSLAGTPLADRGYVATFFDYKRTHRCDANNTDEPSACVGFSRDGIHFDVDESVCWIPHHSDTSNPVIYNPWTKEFLIYCRSEQTDRRVCVVTTSDFKTFSPVSVVLQPDAEDPVGREFYGLSPYRNDDVFAGLLSIYDAEPTEKVHCKMEGTNEMQLAYSYNGRNWYRAFRASFIARTEAGSMGGGQVYASPIGVHKNRLLFGGMVSWTEHGGDIEHCEAAWKDRTWGTYLYEMRPDAFVYLRTRAKYGLIRTKAIVPQGGELTVNVRTSPSGHVKAAVLDTSHRPLANYTLEDAIPVRGDELRGTVRWRERKNLDELKGKSVILEVQVREGELYALRTAYHVHLGEHVRDRL
jgi:hypothetical protein